MSEHEMRAIEVAIAAQREAANAELALIRGQLRAFNQRAVALRELLAACDEADAALGTDPLPRCPRPKPKIGDLITTVLDQDPSGGLRMADLVERVLIRDPALHPKSIPVAATRLKQAGRVANKGGRWSLI